MYNSNIILVKMLKFAIQFLKKITQFMLVLLVYNILHITTP